MNKSQILVLLCICVYANLSRCAIVTKSGKLQIKQSITTSYDVLRLRDACCRLRTARGKVHGLTRQALRGKEVVAELKAVQKEIDDLQQRMPAIQFAAVLQEFEKPLVLKPMASKL